jgi:hypothetical protein
LKTTLLFIDLDSLTRYPKDIYSYCGIILICEGQCQWVNKILLLHGDIFPRISKKDCNGNNIYRDGKRKQNYICGDANSWVRLIHDSTMVIVKIKGKPRSLFCNKRTAIGKMMNIIIYVTVNSSIRKFLNFLVNL